MSVSGRKHRSGRLPDKPTGRPKLPEEVKSTKLRAKLKAKATPTGIDSLGKKVPLHPAEILYGSDPDLIDVNVRFEDDVDGPSVFKKAGSQSVAARTAEAISEGMGKRIREAMNNVEGLDQQELADLTGYSRGNINRVIMGRQFPSIPLLIKMSEALGVSVDYLLGVKGNDNYTVGGQYYNALQERYDLAVLILDIMGSLSMDKRIRNGVKGNNNKRRPHPEINLRETIQYIMENRRHSSDQLDGVEDEVAGET